MRKYIAIFIFCMVVVPAFAAGRSLINNNASRAGMINGAGRMPTLSVPHTVNNNSVVSGATNNASRDDNGAVADDDASVDVDVPPVNRDKEKLACISNNVGVGNTFVWASKDSNTSSYASMVEDVKNPENNVCFVLVGMRADDSRINVSDIQPQYFEWGKNITCGAWTDEAKLEKRILDAKKTARTLATVGGAVGGAGIGVGAMELFGNKALSNINGLQGLEGQKQFDEGSTQWYAAKAAELKNKAKNNNSLKIEYNRFVELVDNLRAECNGENPDSKCNEAKYKNLAGLKLEKL